MTYGGYLRTKPRINIKRGFAGNEPQSITLSATPKLNEGILSGMLIELDTNGQWVKSVTGGTANTVAYFAFSDQSDTDVISSGKLLGLSCLGEFELQTGYFDATQTYAVGDPVVKSATAGSVTKGASFLSAIEVVGVVSQGAKEDVSKINSEAAVATGRYLLNLVTRWKPSQS